MRVLWLVRDNLKTHPGGDTTQILQTSAALREQGVKVDFAEDLAQPPTGYDLVHLFHLDRLWEHLFVCRRLNECGTPAVLSTIYWPANEFDRKARAGVQGAMARWLGGDNYQTARLMQRFALDLTRRRKLHYWDRRLLSFPKAARRLLETVSVILPNSEIEREMIEQRFDVVRPAIVVPNAVNAEAFTAKQLDPARRAGVLCAGRIEPRKNQLALIEALSGSGIELTIVGAAGRYNRKYADRCRAAADKNVRFLGHCSAGELADLYRAARAHACVSWYETPGLASLEAALCGCNLAVTPGGSTREYFGDDACYCSPDDPRSIRAAVENTLASPPRTELAERVAREFNWRRAAEQTLRGYELARRR